jgi:hypothetical protein
MSAPEKTMAEHVTNRNHQFAHSFWKNRFITNAARFDVRLKPYEVEVVFDEANFDKPHFTVLKTTSKSPIKVKHYHDLVHFIFDDNVNIINDAYGSITKNYHEASQSWIEMTLNELKFDNNNFDTIVNFWQEKFLDAINSKGAELSKGDISVLLDENANPKFSVLKSIGASQLVKIGMDVFQCKAYTPDFFASSAEDVNHFAMPSSLWIASAQQELNTRLIAKDVLENEKAAQPLNTMSKSKDKAFEARSHAPEEKLPEKRQQHEGSTHAPSMTL